MYFPTMRVALFLILFVWIGEDAITSAFGIPSCHSKGHGNRQSHHHRRRQPLSEQTSLPCLTAARRHFSIPASLLKASASSSLIEYQADSNYYGRGEMHLSAAVEEGDVVVYQTGTWFVDGVEVGDGTPTKFELAKLETIQVVWTHNCEHGVLRGMAVTLNPNDPTKLEYTNEKEEEEVVEFGPEQLVAKLPVEWDESTGIGIAQMALDPSLWSQELE